MVKSLINSYIYHRHKMESEGKSKFAGSLKFGCRIQIRGQKLCMNKLSKWLSMKQAKRYLGVLRQK